IGCERMMRTDGIDPLAFQPFPCLLQELSLAFELLEHLRDARLVTLECGTKASAFTFQFFHSLPERLLETRGLDSRCNGSAASQAFDRVEPPENAVTQFLEIVDQARRV